MDDTDVWTPGDTSGPGPESSTSNRRIPKDAPDSPVNQANRLWQTSHYLRDKLRPFVPYLDKPAAFWEAASHTPRPSGVWTLLDVIQSWIKACDEHHDVRCHA